MNILFVENSLDPSIGGIERVTYKLYDFFKSVGHTVFFAYYKFDYEDINNKIKLNTHRKSNKIDNDLYKYIIENKIDVIINQGVYSIGLAKLYKKVKKLNQCKIINCFHTAPDFYKHYNKSFLGDIKDLLHVFIFKYNPLVYKIRLMYDVSNCFILLSKSFIPEFKLLYGIKDASKLIFNSNPLPFDEVPSPSILSKKKKQVLILTRFEEFSKNILSALRIWKILETNNAIEGWELIIAGYGKDEDVLKKFIKLHSLKNIKFYGKVTDPRSLYAESSVFMMTSKYEGFGMTLIESMQFGCVPLAYDSFSTVHDILVDGYNGYIVPAFDEICYSKKLLLLISNNTIRNNMAIAALSYSQKFNIETIGEAWCNILDGLVNISK